MPISSGAIFADPNINITQGLEIENALPILAPTAPLRLLYDNNSWWPGATCNASGSSQQVPIPDGYVVPAPPSGGDGSLPNRIGGVLRADGTTIVEFQYATRCNSTGSLTAGDVRCSHSIYGSGMCSYGAQGGSGLSGVGGVLRLHEVGGVPIPHVLKLTVYSSILSSCNGGYRWPAIAADGYYNSGSFAYVGSMCDFRMGSLMALPATYNCQAYIGTAREICTALKHYGAYVGDTHPGWNPVSIIGEWGTASAIGLAAAQIEQMAEALLVVTNNGPSSVGGGGVPLVPLAPPIGN